MLLLASDAVVRDQSRAVFFFGIWGVLRYLDILYIYIYVFCSP